MSDEQQEQPEAQQPPVEMEGSPDAAAAQMEGPPGGDMEAPGQEQQERPPEQQEMQQPPMEQPMQAQMDPNMMQQNMVDPTQAE